MPKKTYAMSAKLASVLSVPHISNAKTPSSEIQKDVRGATNPKKAHSEKYQNNVASFVQQNYNNKQQLEIFFDCLSVKLVSSDVITAFRAHHLFHINVFSDIGVHPHYKYSTVKIFVDSQVILPNLAVTDRHLKSSLGGLLKAYNRYLNQRLLDFGRLKIDIIREKRYERKAGNSPYGSSGASTSTSSPSITTLSNDFELTADYLKHTQCALYQLRLILDCLFPDDIIQDQTLLPIYNLLAIDMSILFSVICDALVLLLQNFFSLIRPDAERTLFLYKEFTQLELPQEVLNFVDMAPNMANPHDLNIPSAIKKDPEGIKKLTKALESYLYAEEQQASPTYCPPSAASSTFYTPPSSPSQIMGPAHSSVNYAASKDSSSANTTVSSMDYSDDVNPPGLVSASSPVSAVSSPLSLEEFDDSWASSVLDSLDSNVSSILRRSPTRMKSSSNYFILGPVPAEKKKSSAKLSLKT